MLHTRIPYVLWGGLNEIVASLDLLCKVLLTEYRQRAVLNLSVLLARGVFSSRAEIRVTHRERRGRIYAEDPRSLIGPLTVNDSASTPS